jgi:hypothetical protein
MSTASSAKADGVVFVIGALARLTRAGAGALAGPRRFAAAVAVVDVATAALTEVEVEDFFTAMAPAKLLKLDVFVNAPDSLKLPVSRTGTTFFCQKKAE